MSEPTSKKYDEVSTVDIILGDSVSRKEVSIELSSMKKDEVHVVDPNERTGYYYI